jgi:hypothetical protein
MYSTWLYICNFKTISNKRWGVFLRDGQNGPGTGTALGMHRTRVVRVRCIPRRHREHFFFWTGPGPKTFFPPGPKFLSGRDRNQQFYPARTETKSFIRLGPGPKFFSRRDRYQKFFSRRTKNDWSRSCLVFLIDHYEIRLHLVENPSKEEGTSILWWIVFPILVVFLIASLLIWKRKEIKNFYNNKAENTKK